MDYSKISGKDCGQRLAFEELTCQLGRREYPSTSGEFRRIEGSGGDGGIEGYWLFEDGSEVGYQAKYYLKVRDIAWEKIDDSVERALKSHPSLKKYVVSIPCDLTDRSGLQGAGKTGWIHWENHKSVWEKLCADSGRPPVEFVAWTASDLTDRLMHPNAEGLRTYWFGDVEFSQRWLRDLVELAVESLDERYHPEDHVEVGIERLSKVILRDDEILGELKVAFSDLSQSSRLERFIKKEINAETSSGIQKIESETSKATALRNKFNNDYSKPWPVTECISYLAEASSAIHNLKSSIWRNKQSSASEASHASNDLDYIIHKLDKLGDAVYRLSSILESRYFQAEQTRCALLEGKAGTGKSHTLGTIAQKAISDGRPALLILGQQFGSQNFWGQLTNKLGLGTISPEAFLQALSVAAETAGKRGLVLIDAINEGAGATLWRNELPELIARVKNYENIALVISCRTEYTPYVVPSKIRENLPSFSIRGFETDEEQSRAATVYLGRRGISQPNTPWLSAEFVNPLFLRSACTALARDGIKQFPKGLHGTKIVFAFYIRSVARNLGVGRDGSEELVKPTITAVSAIAALMASNRTDYISLAEAGRIASDKFSLFPTPPSMTWFEVLQKNGIFRLDPPPRQSEIDPFSPAEDIVRFSFQRLQDHLMASVLLDGVTDPREALEGGTLSFIHGGNGLKWKWAGLAEALSIQMPENFRVELIDAMPGETDTWANDYSIRNAFLESLRWRNAAGFTDRTLQIYNAFLSCDDSQFYIVIELCASIDHPWNAEFLHKVLMNKKLPTRDAFWTSRINVFLMSEGSTLRRLLDWCASSQNENTDPQVQILCGLTVAWLTAASHREIRDKATKALSSLLLSNIQLYNDLCAKFSGLDDLYVLERLHAAAYGAGCIDPSPRRLNLYSATTFDHVFGQKSVPLSIMLRDYGLGIIELASSRGCLPETIDIEICRPPYKSKAVRLSVSKDKLDETASKAGGKEIKHSCTGGISDFADEIKSRVRAFSNVPLSSPMPYTQNEKYDRFQMEVIDPHPDRSDIVAEMHSLYFNPFLALRLSKASREIRDNTEQLKKCETALFNLLNPNEKLRFKEEFKGRFTSSNKSAPQLPQIDIGAAQLWVAKRAYDYGWTGQLFPGDSSHRHGYSRDRPLFERIGAKYEWMALDELLCRLADSKWMTNIGVDGSRRYRTTLNLDFHRDIDPTILTNLAGGERCSVDAKPVALEEVSENDLKNWPFEKDPSSGMAGIVCRTDQAGDEWLVLYEHRSATDRYEDQEGREHGQRQEEWRYLLPVVVRKEDRKRLVDYLYSQCSIDVSTWSGSRSTDAGYLLEAPWRSTWEQKMWTPQHFHKQGKVEVAFPCFSYCWESHLDASLPEGAAALLPAPWLAMELSLTPLASDSQSYADSSGTRQFVSRQSRDDGSHAYVRRELFENFLKKDDLECVWIFAAERCVWPGGSNTYAAWRRSEGVVWFESGKPKMKAWKDDHRNGIPKAHPVHLESLISSIDADLNAPLLADDE